MESILADVERLGLQYMKPITYTSDYFPQMLDLAERLIRAGHMYADDTPVEQMRAVRALLPFHVKMSSEGWQDAPCPLLRMAHPRFKEKALRQHKIKANSYLPSHQDHRAVSLLSGVHALLHKCPHGGMLFSFG